MFIRSKKAGIKHATLYKIATSSDFDPITMFQIKHSECSSYDLINTIRFVLPSHMRVPAISLHADGINNPDEKVKYLVIAMSSLAAMLHMSFVLFFGQSILAKEETV